MNAEKEFHVYDFSFKEIKLWFLGVIIFPFMWDDTSGGGPDIKYVPSFLTSIDYTWNLMACSGYCTLKKT